MKWITWIVAALVLYVLSIGPVAYFETRSKLGPGYLRGSYTTSRCTSYVFFKGTAEVPYFSSLPEWMQKFYAPLSSAATGSSGPGSWVNDYAGWWVGLAY